jgi:hypothetical protein
MLCLLCVWSLSASTSLLLNHSSHSSIALRQLDEVIITIGSDPLLLVLPSVIDYSATVYKRVNTTNFYIGEFRPDARAMAVLFPAGGRVVVSAAGATFFEYFSVALGRPCLALFVSSADSEYFLADSHDNGSNLTIRPAQEYCIVHVSDAPSDVLVNFSTDPLERQLRYFSADAQAVLAGEGSFAGVAGTFARLEWLSGAVPRPISFAVSIRSPRSTLPRRRGFFNAKAPAGFTDPEMIYDVEGGPDRLSQNPYFNAGLVWAERSYDTLFVNLILAVLTAFFALLVGVLACIGCLSLQRKSCVRPQTDDAQVEMLEGQDIAGVADQQASGGQVSIESPRVSQML